MKKNTKALISIVLAGAALICIVLFNRALAPTPEDTPSSIFATGTPTQAQGATTTPPDTQTDVGVFTLTLGKSTTVGGYTFALKSIDDSRCPPGVTCIWAGEVRAHIEVVHKAGKSDVVATFPGDWMKVEERSVKVTKVLPAAPNENRALYVITFEVR